jgi:predicted dehydrogenase
LSSWYTNMTLVKGPGPLKLAMLGMVDGNGHPFSWSAILNGFNPEAMARCPYPVIYEYLRRQPADALGIAGARVTHVWCEDAAQARHVAEAALIPNVLRNPTEVIGQVDAVIIPTDIGYEHVRRAGVFLEAGLPVFIDKPLVDNEADLRQFVRWHREGKAFLSTSALRFSREYAETRARLAEIGELRWITMTMPKSWERYGIHALEGVYPFLPPVGWVDVANTGRDRVNVVHLHHETGVEVTLAVMPDLSNAFGVLNLYGTKSTLAVRFQDTFYAFKTQLEQFVDFVRTGVLPVPFAETIELMKLLIAGTRSRQESGRRVPLSEITLD